MNILDIYIIGLGGIGSNFLTLLSPYLHGDSETQKRLNRIYLIDGDMVSSNNLQRTPYYRHNVNCNKVTACKQNYSDRLPIVPGAFFINAQNVVQTFEPSNKPNIDLCVIACTDHIYERALTLNYVMSDGCVCPNILWITAGNARNYGLGLSWVKVDGVKNPGEYPTPFDIYPQYQEQLRFAGRTHTGALGCGMSFDTANEAGQTLVINTLSSFSLLYMLTEFYTNKRQIPALNFTDNSGVVSLGNLASSSPIDLTSFGNISFVPEDDEDDEEDEDYEDDYDDYHDEYDEDDEDEYEIEAGYDDYVDRESLNEDY